MGHEQWHCVIKCRKGLHHLVDASSHPTGVCEDKVCAQWQRGEEKGWNGGRHGPIGSRYGTAGLHCIITPIVSHPALHGTT